MQSAPLKSLQRTPLYSRQRTRSPRRVEESGRGKPPRRRSYHPTPGKKNGINLRIYGRLTSSPGGYQGAAPPQRNRHYDDGEFNVMAHHYQPAKLTPLTSSFSPL